MKLILLLTTFTVVSAKALDYPHTTAEPQKTGWPLSAEERAYVLKPEFERRPGSEEHVAGHAVSGKLGRHVVARYA